MNHKEYLKKIGKKGGMKKSAKKAATSKENGKKGGRPRSKLYQVLFLQYCRAHFLDVKLSAMTGFNWLQKT